MLTHFAQLYPQGLIRYTQTSFLELVTDTEVHRIDFENKLTFRLRRGTGGPVSFPQHHPLLDALYVPLSTLMARATPHSLTDTPALLAALRAELTQHPQTWYDFRQLVWTTCGQCFADYNVLPNLTRTGGIILDSVPTPVAQVVARLSADYGVETYCLPQRIPSPTTHPFQLLLVGHNYVIARDFYISTLR